MRRSCLAKLSRVKAPRHRDRQPCLAQALRRIVMAMVEQMIRRPGDTKPAVADNAHRLFRCDGGSEIGPQFQIPSFTDLKPEGFNRRLLRPLGPDRLMNPDFDDALRRPQERTEHPRKALTLFQKPRALCIAPFFIDTWLSWRTIRPGDTVVAAGINTGASTGNAIIECAASSDTTIEIESRVRNAGSNLANIHNARPVDRRDPATGNGRGCGKRLLPCRERVNPRNTCSCGGNFLTHPPRLHFSPLTLTSDCPSLRASSDDTIFLPSSLASPSGGRPGLVLTARIERAHSDRAPSASARDDQAAPSLCFHHFQSRIEFMPAGRATDAIRFDRKFV